MASSKRLVLAAALGLVLTPAAAVTVVECVDAEGNSSFRDTCPPGTTKKGEKQLRGLGGTKEMSIAQVAASNPVTVYVVPECDACDLVRNSLSSREIPFKEVDVQDNAELQQELKSIAGGLTVPAIVVGDDVLTGYSRDAIDGALAKAGYPVVPSAR
ncbi:MAG: glutaredoxin family protein [Gammaproteobacteria bacterium]